MWQEVFNMAISNGIWAVLFCALLIFQLKDSKTRESKYQKTIEDLNSTLKVVNKVGDKVEKIDKEVEKVGENIVSISKKLARVSHSIDNIGKKVEVSNSIKLVSNNLDD